MNELMKNLGVITTLFGLALTLIGLAAGFWKLFEKSEAALFWLSLVPFGFIGLLLGITLTQLSKR
jgi:uncharacterized membrane protein